jgi:hypothetical protein
MIEEIKPGYTRISDILKPFTNFNHIDKNILANAADRGTRVHDYCNAYANNIFLADIDEDCQYYVNAFIDWYDLNCVKLLYSEKRLYHDLYKITGKFDLIVKIKNTEENILIDIKTPVIESKTWPIQLGGYCMLIKESMDMDIHRCLVLKLPKSKGKAEEIEYTKIEKNKHLFNCARQLHNHFQK